MLYLRKWIICLLMVDPESRLKFWRVYYKYQLEFNDNREQFKLNDTTIEEKKIMKAISSEKSAGIPIKIMNMTSPSEPSSIPLAPFA